MNQKRIVECVPNFSEGRDMEVIKKITDSIEKVYSTPKNVAKKQAAENIQ